MAVAVMLLGIRIFFFKGGRFPNLHISGNKHLRSKGIGCATSQDREAHKNPKNKIDTKQLLNTNTYE